MSEEQIGATVTEAAPAESAPATETTVTDAAQSAVSKPATAESVQTPNWDSDDNPWYAAHRKTQEELTGTRGALKQQTERARQAEAEARAIRQQLEDDRREQQEYAVLQAERSKAQQGDPDDPFVKQRLAEIAESERQLQARRQQAPQIQQEAQQRAARIAAQQTDAWAVSLAEAIGVKAEEVGTLSDQAKQRASEEIQRDFPWLESWQAQQMFNQRAHEYLRQGIADRAKERLAAAEVARVRAEAETSRKALEERLKALERGSQRSPDTSTGQVASNNDEAIWLREYGEGSHDSPADHAKARKLLARYN